MYKRKRPQGDADVVVSRVPPCFIRRDARRDAGRESARRPLLGSNRDAKFPSETACGRGRVIIAAVVETAVGAHGFAASAKTEPGRSCSTRP